MVDRLGRAGRLHKASSLLLSIVLAFGCLVPSSAYAQDGTAVDSANESTISSVADDGASKADAGIDITETWRAGELTLSDAGTYHLSDDVETSGMLTIKAAEGQTITLDFKGHSAVVKGAVYAGIDVSDSEGTVIIKDSSYEDKVATTRAAGDDGAVVPDVRLTVEANKVDDAVCGIYGDYASLSPEGVWEEQVPAPPRLELHDFGIDVNLNTVDASSTASTHDAFGIYLGYADEQDRRTDIDALIDNCSVSVSLNNIEVAEDEQRDLLETYSEKTLSTDQTGVAYGIYTKSSGTTLEGAFASKTSSAQTTCDLYSTAENAFFFESSFAPASVLRVYAAGNADGTVFAQASSDLSIDEQFLSLFANASDNANVLSDVDMTLQFVAPVSSDDRDSDTSSSKSPSIDFAIDTVQNFMQNADDAPAEQKAWSVSAADGSPLGSYDSFDEAEEALPTGGAVVLNADAPSESISFSKGSPGERYGLDLGGHALGNVIAETAADLTVSNGTLAGAPARGMGATKVVGAQQWGSGTLVIRDARVQVSIDQAMGLGSGVDVQGEGPVSLDGVDVDVSTALDDAGSPIAVRGGAVCGVSAGHPGLQSAETAYPIGAIELKGATSVDVSAPSSQVPLAAGVYRDFGSTVSVADASVSVSGAAAELAGVYVFEGTAAIGTDASVSVSCAGGSQTANGVKVAEQGEDMYGYLGVARAEIDGASVSVVLAEGVEAAPSACAVSQASAFALSSVSLTGAGSLSSCGVADVYLQTASLELGADFSPPQGAALRVNCPELDGGLFAKLSESADGPSLAGLFEPAAGSFYEGKAATATEAGLVWADAPAETFRISYDANGGLGEMGETETEGGKAVVAACSFSREGYSFSGWNTALDGSGEAHAAGDEATLTSNLVLYAQWKKDMAEGSVTITLHPQWPDDSVGDAVMLTGVPGTLLNADQANQTLLTYEHYTLKQWTDVNGNTGATYSYPAKYPSTWLFPKTSIDLYASWEHNVSSIRFNPSNPLVSAISFNGFEGDPILDGDGNPVTAFPDPGEREGYEFVGWYKQGDSEQTILSDSDLPTTYPSGKVVYIGKWKMTSEESPDPDTPTAEEPIDLYTLLTNNGVPKTGNVELEYQGSYYLSQSVEGFTGHLIIDKKGSYDIDLQGNGVTFGTGREETVNESNQSIEIGTSGSYATEGASAVQVAVRSTDGSDQPAQGGLAFINGGQVAVYGDASLSMSNIDVSKSYTLTDKLQNYVYSSALSVTSNGGSNTQALSLDSCNITLDCANQTAGGGSNLSTSYKNTVTAVKIASIGFAGATIKDSTIKALAGKPAKADGATQTNLDAIALFVIGRSGEDGTVSVADSTLSAIAEQGSAYALFNNKYKTPNASIVLEGDTVTFEATGKGEGSPLSIGLLNVVGKHGTTASAMPGSAALLDAEVTFTTSATSNAYALASDAAGTSANDAPFVLRPGFAAGGSTLSVLLGLDYDYGTNAGESSGSLTEQPVKPVSASDSANAVGTCVASFAADVSDEQKDVLASALSNGVAGSKTYLVNEGDGLRFEADLGNAEAYIERDGEQVPYATFETAVAAAKNDETVVLNKNLNRAITFDATDEEKADGATPANLTYKVDLAGYAVGKFVCSSAATIEVFTSRRDSQSALTGVRASGGSAAQSIVGVDQAGSGTLVLDGIDISVQNADTLSYGAVVSGSGTLRCIDSDVSVQSVSQDSSGIFVSKGSLDMAGGSVTVKSSSDTVIGINIPNGAGRASLAGCEVSVQGAGTTMAAASVVGGTLVAGPGDGGAATKLLVEDVKSAKAIYGVYASSAASIDLESCEVSLSAAEDVADSLASSAEVWNVYATGSTAAVAPVVKLGGESIFNRFGVSDAAHVYHAANALQVADDFSLSASGVSCLNVQSLGLANDVFASPVAEGGSLDGKDGLFAAAEVAGNHYLGWDVATANGSLTWTTSAVARVEGKEMYSSLAAAINAAQAGDTITILKDCSSAALAVGKQLTVDLAGRSVSVSSVSVAGISVSGGRLTVKDSGLDGDPMSTGTLQVSLAGMAGESEQSVRRGFDVSSGGALTLDGSSVQVAYAGSGMIGSVSGVSLRSDPGAGDAATVLMTGEAQLSASASKGETGFYGAKLSTTSGASKVYGIYRGLISNSATLSVSVEAGSSVDVSNATSTFLRYQSATTSTTGDGIYIREFTADEDSALYAEILAAFKVNAQYDGSAGTGEPGATYGAGVYWAAPMQLEDGTRVWAFSKPVAAEDVGKESAIVPEKIYILSDYQVSPDAVGIGGYAQSASSDSDGVSVAGSVSAASSLGSAYALQPAGKMSWSVEEGAQLSASTGGTGAYLRMSAYAPDLKKELGITVSMGVQQFNFYGQSAVREVTEAQPEAIAIWQQAPQKTNAETTVSAIVLNGVASYDVDAEGGLTADIYADKVTMGAGFAADAASVSIADRDGETASGETLAVAAGDQALTPAQRDAFVDATGAFDPVLSADGKSLVWGKSYTLTFVDFYGNVVSTVKGIQDGNTVALPSADVAKRDDTTTETFPLMGWSTDASVDPYDEADEKKIVSGDSFVFASPEDSDSRELVYHAVYGKEARQVQVTFANAKDASGADIAPATVVAGAGTGLEEGVTEQVPEAADYGTWRFVGWKAGVPKDGSSSVSGSLVMTDRVVDPSDLGSYMPYGDVTLTAYYVNVSDDQQLTVFKVDDYLYAYAVDDGTYPTFKKCMEAMGETDSALLNADPTKTVEGQVWTFSGWHGGRSDERDPYPNADFGSTALLEEAASGAETAYYTAVFAQEGATTVTVTLHYYNEWNGTWRYNLIADASKDDQVQVPYDADIGTSASNGAYLKDGVAIGYVEKAADGSYQAHRFLGWSTRPTDKEPLTDLPKAGHGISDYYAIYSDETMSIGVTFVGADGESGTVKVPSTGSVQDAMNAEGYELDIPEGKVLTGWAYEADAEQPSVTTYSLAKLVDATTLTVPKTGDGKTEGAATYYAVFADAEPVTVVLHGMTDEAWTDKTLAVTPGKPIDTTGNGGYTAPWKKGWAFIGWNDKEDGTGRSFDIGNDAVPDEDLELWAQYVPIEVAGDIAEGTTVSVAQAYINSDAALSASGAEVSLTKVSASDASIGLSRNYPTVQAYRLALKVQRATTSSEVNEGFGSLELTLPLPAAYASRDVYAYLLNADGTTTALKCTVDANGDASTATVSVAGYGLSSSGNVVLTYGLTSEEKGVRDARESARAQLQNLYDSYYEGDYESGDWETLVRAFEGGNTAVDSATTVTEVQQAAQTAADAMADVTSKRGLETAKATALQRLADAYAGYSKSNYSTDNWNVLVAAYNSAKSAINQASNESDANTAASNGILAMANVKTGGGTSSGLSSTGGSGLSSGGGSGSGLSSSGAGDEADLSATTGVASTMLGAQLETLTAELAADKGTAVESGVYVASVDEGGPAQEAGIQAGDVIVAVDGTEVASLDDMESILSDKNAGDTVEVEIDRNGERSTYQVTLDEASAVGLESAQTTSDGSEGSEEQPTGSAAVQKWLRDNLVLVCVLALLAIAAASALAWWLLRRRNRGAGGEDDDDFWEGDDEALAGSPA